MWLQYKRVTQKPFKQTVYYFSSPWISKIKTHEWVYVTSRWIQWSLLTGKGVQDCIQMFRVSVPQYCHNTLCPCIRLRICYNGNDRFWSSSDLVLSLYQSCTGLSCLNIPSCKILPKTSQTFLLWVSTNIGRNKDFCFRYMGKQAKPDSEPNRNAWRFSTSATC